MISVIEALHFRCLRYCRQELGSFHVLVGPNASGKTTFLDVVAFLGRLVADGLDAAIDERTRNFRDLVWNRSGEQFELAVEVRIPDDRLEKLSEPTFDTLRYEVGVGLDPKTDELSIRAEKVLLKKSDGTDSRMVQRAMFPDPAIPKATILSGKSAKGTKGVKPVVSKSAGGNDNYYAETGKGWQHSFKLGPRKSALGNLPDDESHFPVSTWFKRLLVDGVQQLVLNSLLIRKASPPGQVRGFKPDGSNLPWVIQSLYKDARPRFNDWIAHVRTALPDIDTIKTKERPDDRHRYLIIGYRGGLAVPSWTASDGTLRLLALTLPAYLPDFSGVYLIEEPENGIHPRAVDTVFQSLSSVYGAQMLLATHSPVILSAVNAEQVLCFAKSDEGATDIIPGNKHPALADWKHDPSLGVLFAAGVLG